MSPARSAASPQAAGGTEPTRAYRGLFLASAALCTASLWPLRRFR